MNCCSRGELRSFLLQEPTATRQARIDEHVSSCAACCRTLDLLASDDLIGDYFEAARRDAGNGLETVEWDAASPTAIPPARPDWQPGGGAS